MFYLCISILEFKYIGDEIVFSYEDDLCISILEFKYYFKSIFFPD